MKKRLVIIEFITIPCRLCLENHDLPCLIVVSLQSPILPHMTNYNPVGKMVFLVDHYFLRIDKCQIPEPSEEWVYFNNRDLASAIVQVIQRLTFLSSRPFYPCFFYHLNVVGWIPYLYCKYLLYSITVDVVNIMQRYQLAPRGFCGYVIFTCFFEVPSPLVANIYRTPVSIVKSILFHIVSR